MIKKISKLFKSITGSKETNKRDSELDKLFKGIEEALREADTSNRSTAIRTVENKSDEEIRRDVEKLRALGIDVRTYSPRCPVCSTRMRCEETTDKLKGTGEPVMVLFCTTCDFICQSSADPAGKFLGAFEPKAKSKFDELEMPEKGPDGKLLN